MFTLHSLIEFIISKYCLKGLPFYTTCILFGETYNQDKHGYGVEIKAISYHLLLVEEGPPAHLRVILDL